MEFCFGDLSLIRLSDLGRVCFHMFHTPGYTLGLTLLTCGLLCPPGARLWLLLCPSGGLPSVHLLVGTSFLPGVSCPGPSRFSGSHGSFPGGWSWEPRSGAGVLLVTLGLSADSQSHGYKQPVCTDGSRVSAPVCRYLDLERTPVHAGVSHSGPNRKLLLVKK